MARTVVRAAVDEVDTTVVLDGSTDAVTSALSATSVPIALGTAAAGTGTGFSRQGHVHPTTGLLLAANNLSDVTAATARTNLGLGGAAVLAVGTTAGTVAAGDDSRVTGAAQKSSNLSDLVSASTARTNLGLGGAAVLAVGTTTGTVAAGDDSRFRAVAGVHTAFAAAGPFSNDTSNHTVGTATTVPLASLSVGSFFRFLIAGTFDTSSSQTPTGTMICKHNINAVQMFSGNITVSQTSVYGANQPWQMEGYILVTSMGTAGVGAQVLIAATRWSRSAAAVQLSSYDQAGLITVDLSSGLAYTTTVSTSTASTFNVVRSLGGFFEHVR